MITGLGTQEEPFAVTTLAELIEKVSAAENYVKLGNDINVLDEYPDGDVPLFTVNGHLDGDGHTISNWYSLGTAARAVDETGIISINDGSIENLNFTNINTERYFIYGTSKSKNYGVRVKKCSFSGECQLGFHNHAQTLPFKFSQCSFNIRSISPFSTTYNTPLFEDCCIEFSSSADCIFYAVSFSKKDFLKDSYIKAKLPNMYGISKSKSTSGGNADAKALYCNNAFDITTESTFSVGSDEGTLPSIINTDHAPNVSAVGYMRGVSDEKWLDIEYLISIGFNGEVR